MTELRPPPEHVHLRWHGRFWMKVDKRGEDECWPWLASCQTPGGYGQIWINRNKLTRSHIAAWSISRGPVPDGLCVCHDCDNKWCCNPKHLFLGTLKDNAVDMAIKARNFVFFRTGEGHPRSKISDADRSFIKGTSLAEWPSKRLAERFGLTYRHINKIRNETPEVRLTKVYHDRKLTASGLEYVEHRTTRRAPSGRLDERQRVATISPPPTEI